MENRGWIYYRRKKTGSGAGGNVLMPLHEIFEPGAKYVIEERKQEEEEDDDSEKTKGPTIGGRKPLDAPKRIRKI